MGERAFNDEGASGELSAMKRELRDAIRPGARAFSTSRNRNHQTPDSGPVASRLANWDEVRQLVGVLGDLGAGVFEIAQEDVDRSPELLRDFNARLKALALETGVPTTFGGVYSRRVPAMWRSFYELADETVAAGGKILVQGTSRWVSPLLSFQSTMPFYMPPLWLDLAKLPLAEQEAMLRKPQSRRKLVRAPRQPT